MLAAERDRCLTTTQVIPGTADVDAPAIDIRPTPVRRVGKLVEHAGGLRATWDELQRFVYDRHDRSANSRPRQCLAPLAPRPAPLGSRSLIMAPNRQPQRSRDARLRKRKDVRFTGRGLDSQH